MESCSCWQYIYDYLDDAGYNVVLTNPLQVRLIATSRKKTDRHDARIIADLLRMNSLPLSYAAAKWIREQRQISRHRASLGRLRGQIKNKINALLLRNGIEHDYTDVFGTEGLEYLASLDLPQCDRFELDNYIALIRHLTIQANKTEARIEAFTKLNPDAQRLITIPGISHYSALMILSEIGDIRRFDSSEKLTSFAGLNPSVYQSGKTLRYGHISKQGDKYLRWILINARM